MDYTVKQLAELAGVSVRTLHHYDHIGLLKPATTTSARYRIYRESELARLQQIMFFRELGFELRTIGQILDRPDFDEHSALTAHRELLTQKQDQLGQLIQTIDETLSRMERNEPMSDNQMFRGFDSRRVEEQIERYHDEAVERYGQKSVEQSEAWVRSLSQNDLQRIEAETADINRSMASLMDTNTPDSDAVQRQVERWFHLLNSNFGSYTPESFAGLGELYVADERFTAHYDEMKPGLAQFFRDGMKAFAERQTAE